MLIRNKSGEHVFGREVDQLDFFRFSIYLERFAADHGAFSIEYGIIHEIYSCGIKIAVENCAGFKSNVFCRCEASIDRTTQFDCFCDDIAFDLAFRSDDQTADYCEISFECSFNIDGTQDGNIALDIYSTSDYRRYVVLRPCY